LPVRNAASTAAAPIFRNARPILELAIVVALMAPSFTV
jgi:hypothetical protein